MKEKKPCALLINDIHVSKDNISDFQTNWDEALDVCKSNDISTIIVGGDMWQSRSAQTLATLLSVKQALLKATQQDIELILAEGNHDKCDQESLLGYNHLFVGLQNIEVVDDFTIWDISDSVTLYVMSYFPEQGSFVEKLDAVREDMDSSRTNILYIHEGINGGLSTPSDDELPASIFKDFDAVLVGHYHDRKKIDGTCIEYIGASRQHNFGEDEEKGYTILYTDGSYQFVKNKVNTRFKVIDIFDINELNEDLFEVIKNIKAKGQYRLKLRINCQSKQVSTIDKQMLIDMGVTKVELVTEQTKIKLTESQSIDKKFDKSGIKEEYKNFCSEKSISNIEMGLKYLDKIH